MKIFFVRGFRSGSGGAVFDDFGAVGRSVGQSGARSVGPPSPLAPKEVWSDIASSVCEFCLVCRRLIMG